MNRFLAARALAAALAPKLVQHRFAAFCLVLLLGAFGAPRPFVFGGMPSQSIGQPPVGADSQAEAHASKGLQLIQHGELKLAETELRKAVELAPRNSTYLGTLGAVLGMENRLEQSNHFLSAALRIDSGDTATRRNLASNQFQLGQLLQARGNLEQVLRKEPNDRTARLLLGMVAEEQKDYPFALQNLTAVMDLVRQRPQSMLALARTYYNLSQPERGRATLEELAAQTHVAAQLAQAARIASNAGDYRTAQGLLALIPESTPASDAATLDVATGQYRRREFSQCEATLRAGLDQEPETSAIDNLLGWCLYKQRNFKEAIARMDRAVDLNPREQSNYLDVGMMLIELKRPSGALLASERAIAVAPNSSAAYRLNGIAQLKLGKVGDATRAFTKALELSPNDVEARLGLASALWDSGKTAEAEKVFDEGLRRAPNNALLYQGYGTMLLKVAGRDNPVATRAVAMLKKAVDLDSSLSEPHFQLGNLALANNDFTTAMQELETAARLNPTSSKIHYSLARVYVRTNRTAEGVRERQLFERLKAREDNPLADAPAGPSALAQIKQPQ